MSRLDLITIAIVIVCLGALGYLVYKIVNLMNPPKEETTSIEDSYTDPATDDATYTDWDDEVNTANEDDDLDDAEVGTSATDDVVEGEDSGNYDESEMDNGSDDVAEESTPSTASTADDAGQAATSYDATSSSSSVGKYMVIAGSYRQKVNAENQVAKLHKLGYSDSRVESFNRGSYAVVLVDRFSSYSDAKALVQKLAGNGVESMIKEKN